MRVLKWYERASRTPYRWSIVKDGEVIAGGAVAAQITRERHITEAFERLKTNKEKLAELHNESRPS